MGLKVHQWPMMEIINEKLDVLIERGFGGDLFIYGGVLALITESASKN